MAMQNDSRMVGKSIMGAHKVDSGKSGTAYGNSSGSGTAVVSGQQGGSGTMASTVRVMAPANNGANKKNGC